MLTACSGTTKYQLNKCVLFSLNLPHLFSIPTTLSGHQHNPLVNKGQNAVSGYKRFHHNDVKDDIIARLQQQITVLQSSPRASILSTTEHQVNQENATILTLFLLQNHAQMIILQATDNIEHDWSVCSDSSVCYSTAITSHTEGNTAQNTWNRRFLSFDMCFRKMNVKVAELLWHFQYAILRVKP